MQEEENKTVAVRTTWAKVRRFIRFGITGFILFLITLFMILRIASVQTYIAGKLSEYLSEKTQSEISIGSVYISGFLTAEFKNIRVVDYEDTLMIDSKRIKLDISLPGLLRNRLHIRNVEIDSTYFALMEDSRDHRMRLSHIIERITGPEADTTETQPMELIVDRLEIKNSRYRMDLWSTYNFDEGGMNYTHLDVDSVNLIISGFQLADDSLSGNLEKLTAHDKSGFRLDDFSGQVRLSSRGIDIMNFYLAAGSSWGHFERYSMTYSQWSDWLEFNEKVKFKATIDSAQLNIDDIKYFATSVAGMQDTIRIKGKVRGSVSNLKLRKGEIHFKKNSHFIGDINMTGLPEIEQTFIMLKSKDFNLNVAEINQFYLPQRHKIKLPDFLKRMGTLKIKGRFTGFYNDFVSNAVFRTKLGVITTDLLLKPYGHLEDELSYQGKLTTTNLNFGKLFDNNIIGKVTMVANINGKGVSKSAKADYDINFRNIEIATYNYTDVSIIGSIKEQRIDAKLRSRDGNFKLYTYGSVDYHDSLPSYSLKMNIENARVSRLLMMDKDTLGTISGKFDIDMIGDDLDNLSGSLSIDSLAYEINDKKYFTDSLRLVTNTENNYERFIQLNSEWVDADISGQFRLSELALTYTILFKDIFPSLVKSYGIGNISSYNSSNLLENDYINYNVDLKDTRDLYEIFLPAAKMASGTKIYGYYNLNEDSMIFNFSSPKVSYDRYYADHIKIQIIKPPKKLNLKLESKYFKSKAIFAFDSVNIGLQVVSDTINYRIKWGKWSNHNNNGDFGGSVVLTPDRVDARFNGGRFWINDTLWELSDKGHLYYSFHKFSSTDFNIFSENNSFSMYGSVSEKPSDVLHIDFSNFDLSFFNFYIQENYLTKLGGHLTGNFELSNLWTQAGFSSEFIVRDFTLNDTYMGNASVNSLYSRSRDAFVIDMVLENTKDSLPVKYLDLGGFYYPNRISDNFDLDLYFNDFPVQSLQTYLSSFTSLIEGRIDGKLKIRGNLEEPLILGDLNADIPALRVDYTGTVYHFKDKLRFTKKYFGFDNILIYDQDYQGGKQHEAIATVHITHNNYSNFGLYLDVKPNMLHILDLKENENDLFYGYAYGSGDFRINGTFSNMAMKMDLKSKGNSKISIPIPSENVAERASFITFVQKDDSSRVEKKIETKEVEDDDFSLDISMNLEVTPTTQIEIVMDEVVGDKISARGEGKIRMNYDEYDNFNIYGKYIIERGNYLFTMQNIINKHFIIEPGSYISWDGDLEDARIKMKAVYKVEAKLYDLLQQVDQSEEYKKRYSKVNCIIYLEGSLYSPSIRFDIQLPDESMATQELVKQLLTLSNGKDGSEELNRNFISLLVLGRFLPPSGYDAGTNPGAISKNATEMVANQVGNILNQLSDEVEIGLDWNPGDELTTQEVAIALSYSMLDDRLVIDGRFGTGGGSTSPESAQRIVGDLNVEYKFTKDGRIRGRVFNRTNYYDPLTRKAPYTQGVGIVYRKEFDNLYELFHRTQQEQDEINRNEEAQAQRKKKREEKKAQKKEKKKRKKSDNNTEATPPESKKLLQTDPQDD